MRQTDITILRALIESSGGFVSGNDLAKDLGISRVGVWARLEKLREEGFLVEAIRHRGYRLVEEPPRLNESLLHAYLESRNSRVKVVFREEIDSTNSEAERQLASGLAAPFVVVAATQTRGRGRLGRTWYSPNEGNLYASFAFRPEVPHSQMTTITLWLGLLVCDYLNQRVQIPARIKWPNDLLIEGRKVAGMLTEARIDADRTRDLVFGLGLNVDGESDKWPAEFAKVATSLSKHTEERLPVNRLAADIIEVCLEGYDTFIKGRHSDRLHRLWSQYDALQGVRLEVEQDKRTHQGKADGIGPDGALRLQLDNGQMLDVRSGEVKRV